MHLEYTVVEGDFVNAGTASSSVKKTLKQLNVQPAVIKRVAVVALETVHDCTFIPTFPSASTLMRHSAFRPALMPSWSAPSTMAASSVTA